MPDKYLLIPGTGGSDFKYVGGGPSRYAFGIVAGVFTGDDSLRLELSCEHPSPASSPWKYSRSSLATPELEAFQVLVSTAYQAVPARYTAWAYDWRLDIRWNAQLLLDYLKANIDWRNGERWRIVTHSQGGLVLLAASLLCGRKDEFAQYVRKMALVACPAVGTVRALESIITGNNFGSFGAPLFKLASRTWPALFQMFPHFGCVPSRPLLRATQAALWPESGAVAPFQQQLARADAYGDWFSDPFRNLDGPVALRFVFGRSETPNTRIELSFDGTKDPSLGDRLVTGDSLVPYDETLRFLHACGLQGYTDVVTGSTVPEHMLLLNDSRVWAVCDGFLG